VRHRRAALVAVALAPLLAVGCSDDDEGAGVPGALVGDAAEPGAGEPAAEGVCRLVRLGALEEATGQAFQPGEAGEGTCTFTGRDGRATVTVDVTDLPAEAELALETTSSSCDAGSVEPLEIGAATGAFACTVAGVAVVAGTSGDAYAVVMAAALGDPAVPTAAFPALGEVLELVLERRH
jgi:hypothetical protein